MCICFMFAAMIGRKTDMLTSLAFTAIIILMDNPFLLYYSGFVFSFAAIVSIAIVVPAFSPEKNDEHDLKREDIKSHKNKICNKLLSTLCSTAGIQIASSSTGCNSDQCIGVQKRFCNRRFCYVPVGNR